MPSDRFSKTFRSLSTSLHGESAYWTRIGGGAARGLAHIGVIQALIEAGLEPDIVAGTSIGAVVGSLFAAGRLDVLHGFAGNLTMRKLLRYLNVNLAGSSL